MFFFLNELGRNPVRIRWLDDPVTHYGADFGGPSIQKHYDTGIIKWQILAGVFFLLALWWPIIKIRAELLYGGLLSL